MSPSSLITAGCLYTASLEDTAHCTTIHRRPSSKYQELQ